MEAEIKRLCIEKREKKAAESKRMSAAGAEAKQAAPAPEAAVAAPSGRKKRGGGPRTRPDRCGLYCAHQTGAVIMRARTHVLCRFQRTHESAVCRAQADVRRVQNGKPLQYFLGAMRAG